MDSHEIFACCDAAVQQRDVLRKKVAKIARRLSKLRRYSVGEYGAVLGLQQGTPCTYGSSTAREALEVVSLRPSGAFALHRCDNPECRNPTHMFWGTQSDNARDMVLKGRHKYADGKGGWKHSAFTLEQVEIELKHLEFKLNMLEQELASVESLLEKLLQIDSA